MRGLKTLCWLAPVLLIVCACVSLQARLDAQEAPTARRTYWTITVWVRCETCAATHAAQVRSFKTYRRPVIRDGFVIVGGEDELNFAASSNVIVERHVEPRPEP